MVIALLTANVASPTIARNPQAQGGQPRQHASQGLGSLKIETAAARTRSMALLAQNKTANTKVEKMSENGNTPTSHALETADDSVSRRLLAQVVNKQLPRIANSVAEAVVDERDYQRQMVEDTRANRRNFNRMCTLLGAFFISLIVTYVLSHPGVMVSKSVAHTWGPYSFAITIALDSILTVYAFIKHY